jgi:DNA-binding CsgD family transcriptional regulator
VAHSHNAALRFLQAGAERTLIAYNVDISPKLLSGAEMATVIAYQGAAWTPNLQTWPVTVWSKAAPDEKNASPLTVCIPLHGPQGTKSLVFLPLAEGVKDWYAAALRCVGPLLAAEQELRSIFSSADAPQTPMDLTSEEVESLRWAAKGKTAWESARIQSISERAVVHRLRRAREKLGASSTALAVMTAARLGHIEAL